MKLLTQESIWAIYQEECDQMGIPTELTKGELDTLYGAYETKIRTALAESEDLRGDLACLEYCFKMCGQSQKACASPACMAMESFKEQIKDEGFRFTTTGKKVDQIQRLFVEEK